jgi:pimeloyl-ACP methyl ester carboxylesterase
VRPVARHLYPFDGQRFDVGGGIRMHTLDEGSGPPVVMVHGNPTWSFYFRRLVQELRSDHRCVVPDHVGMGASDRPGDDLYAYTLQRRVDDLETLLVDRLDLPMPVTLIAHDWGGMIAMAWAARDPSRVKRLVLMNTAAFRLPEGTPFMGSLRLTRSVLGEHLVMRHNAFARGAAKWCVTRPMPKEVRDGYLAPYDTPANRLATLRFVQDIPLEPEDRAYGLLRQVETALEDGAFAHVPTLLFWGMKDFIFGESFLDRWTELMPHAEVVRFPDAGHYVLEDAPEAIVSRVGAFLREPAA